MSSDPAEATPEAAPALPPTPSIEAALGAVADYLQVSQNDLTLAFSVWSDGQRGVVVAYVPSETSYRSKMARFSAALNAQYSQK